MVKWALALALTSLWTVAQDSPPLSIAPGNQDVFVADNRSFVQRLTARRSPANIARSRRSAIRGRCGIRSS